MGYSSVCKHLLFVRPLTADEQATLETGLRSSSAFTVRRCQRLLASAEGQATSQWRTTCVAPLRLSATLCMRCTTAAGLWQPLSSRLHTMATLFAAGACESLRALLPQSPRTFGKPPSRWTLALAAEVSCAQGLTPRLVSDETMRLALRRLRVTWKRGQTWSTGPDPAYARQKNGATSSSSGR